MSSETEENKWQVQVNTDNPVFPFLVIDNWYTPTEEKAVWKELDFFSATPREDIKRAETTIVARDPDGRAKSNAYRFYIEDFYKQRDLSPIINSMYKQRRPEFHKLVEQLLPYGRAFSSTNKDSSLLSYYEENDHYEPHHDCFLFTNLIWMVREPRLFNGGDFELNEPKVTIKLRNNRAVFFPCCYLHSVTPVKFHTQPKDVGYGRYTITHFYYSTPSESTNPKAKKYNEK